MTIGWLTDSPDHKEVLFGSVFDSIVCIEPHSTVLPKIGAALVQADAIILGVQNAGVHWYQQLRRRHKSTIPVIVYGVEYWDRMRSEFPILSPDVPGGLYMELPFSPEQLAVAVGQLQPLTDSELHRVVRWYCGLQEEWRSTAHAFANLLSDWPTRKNETLALFRHWTGSVCEFAPDQTANLHRLELALNSGSEDIRAAAQSLEDGLIFVEGPSDVVGEAPVARPPSGFSTIAIADDQGYVASTIAGLKQLGYDVTGPALDRGQALSLIEFWRPQVVICDLNFPSIEDGLAVMNTALADPCVQLVLTTSRARIEPGTLPEGVEDCSGALDFQDVERIHRMIWRRASARGVVEHV